MGLPRILYISFLGLDLNQIEKKRCHNRSISKVCSTLAYTTRSRAVSPLQSTYLSLSLTHEYVQNGSAKVNSMGKVPVIEDFWKGNWSLIHKVLLLLTHVQNMKVFEHLKKTIRMSQRRSRVSSLLLSYLFTLRRSMKYLIQGQRTHQNKSMEDES